MKLFEHQVKALEETKDLNRVAYYLDMGLGKTFVGSEKMVRLGNNVNLIVCQKSKIQDWMNHIKENYSEYQVLNLTTKGGMMAFISWSHANMKIVGVINYELTFRRPELMTLNDFTLMLDESSIIQNTSAKMTKFILKMKPENVILLSGTPVGGKYENLWSQMHLLGWEITEKLYKSTYINWKKIEAGGFTHWIVDKEEPYKNVERLKRKLIQHGSIFMKTEEVMNLPEQTFIDVKVPMIKEYKKYMKDSIITIDDRELVGDTTLTKMLYARQLCSQYNKHKIEAFRDLVESTEDRLIVFYNFTEELERLVNADVIPFDRPISIINGHEKSLDAYENAPNSVTFVQYQAGAKGLNLQKANKIIYFSLPLSSENFEQSKKRIHRIGQEKPCFYYRMICSGSIEEDILQTLEQRKDYTDELFQKQQT